MTKNVIIVIGIGGVISLASFLVLNQRGGSGSLSTRELNVESNQVRFERVELAEIQLELSNPRRVGNHNFASRDRTSLASRQSTSNPDEVFEYGADIMTCCTLQGSHVVLQPLFDKRTVAMSGFLGAAQEFWTEYHPIDRVVTGIHNKQILIPIHQRISSYVFLIKAIHEDTGWRVFEIKLEDLPNSYTQKLVIPDLMKLPAILDRSDGDALMKTVERAAENP